MEFNVDCPVLAVPEKYTFQKIKAVLLSLNYQYNVKTEGLEMLLGIVKKQKAALKILKIEEEIVEVSVPKNDFETLLKGVPSETYCIKNIPSPMAINAFEQLIPVQLHALFVARESFLNRFIFGSDTSNISYGSRVPLLVLPE